jgi:glycosyltransferase involved in cell wall biosynthesis
LKVGVYNEPGQGGIGGSEISVAVVAEALSSKHDVDIVHNKSYVDRESLAEISGTNLSGVNMRYIVPEPYSFGWTRNPLRRYREAKDWQRELSDPYDLFVNFTHGFPPFCHARRGALVVLFPFDWPPHELHRNGGSAKNDGLFKRASSIYHEWEWQRRLASYQTKTTISQFSRTWTTRRWGVDCEVIHPPVDVRTTDGAKQNLILSVGRFTATGHSKKQAEMVDAFRSLSGSNGGQWRYYSIGGLSDASRDHEYFQKVSRLASTCGAHVLSNLGRSRLRELYQQAQIFWHAAGYGEDDGHPEMSEHFGIATVEAMSAGCIPVVINKGGQPEIVEHGVSGFLWKNLEELRRYTEMLMQDEELRNRMRDAAQFRAALFSRERFVDRFFGLLEQTTRQSLL